jgi:hypothetical protein
MSAAAALVARPAAHTCVGGPRRVILSDPAGKRLGEVPLETCAPRARFPARDATQVLVAIGPNWSDRPSTGDALHVVIGKRACFGYVADVDSVSWFSHPRLARADAFSSTGQREVRSLLYHLHSDDFGMVSEIIWETSGRISAHRAPALPAGIDPRTRGSLERARDSAAYWTAIVRILSDSAPGGFANARSGQGRRLPRPGQPDVRALDQSRMV